jgi:hypothetical protein
MTDRLQIVFGGLASSLTFVQTAALEPRLIQLPAEKILMLRDDCRARLKVAIGAANREITGTSDPNALIPVAERDRFCRAFAKHVGDMLVAFIAEVTQRARQGPSSPRVSRCARRPWSRRA